MADAPLVSRQRGRVRLQPGWMLAQLFMVGYLISVVLPMLWTLMNSFKSSREIFLSPYLLPQEPSLDNYVTAWTQLHASSYILNSLITSVASLVVIMSLGSMAAYALARYEFRGSRLIYFGFIGGLIIPAFLIYIPAWFLHRDLGLLDTRQGLVIQYTAFNLPFTVFFLYSFFRTLPKDLEEAAIIDGASLFGVFWRVMLPLSRSGLITVTVFNFLAVWNEYIWALITLSDESIKTIPLGAVNILQQSRYETNWGAMFAGFVIIMIPTLTVYLLFQRKLTEGITVGAVKG